VFLILGLLFRNPIMPTVAVLILGIDPGLPARILKKVSVIFYLESLCPVQAPFRGGGALFASARSDAGLLAVPGLLCLTIALLVSGQPAHPPDGDPLRNRVALQLSALATRTRSWAHRPPALAGLLLTR